MLRRDYDEDKQPTAMMRNVLCVRACGDDRGLQRRGLPETCHHVRLPNRGSNRLRQFSDNPLAVKQMARTVVGKPITRAKIGSGQMPESCLKQNQPDDKPGRSDGSALGISAHDRQAHRLLG